MAASQAISVTPIVFKYASNVSELPESSFHAPSKSGMSTVADSGGLMLSNDEEAAPTKTLAGFPQ
jgi:hypothetical protein